MVDETGVIIHATTRNTKHDHVHLVCSIGVLVRRLDNVDVDVDVLFLLRGAIGTGNSLMLSVIAEHNFVDSSLARIRDRESGPSSPNRFVSFRAVANYTMSFSRLQRSTEQQRLSRFFSTNTSRQKGKPLTQPSKQRAKVWMKWPSVPFLSKARECCPINLYLLLGSRHLQSWGEGKGSEGEKCLKRNGTLQGQVRTKKSGQLGTETGGWRPLFLSRLSAISGLGSEAGYR